MAPSSKRLPLRGSSLAAAHFVAVTATACGTVPAAPTVLAAPEDFPGFPGRATDGAIWLEADLATNRDGEMGRLGRDLLEAGLLAVAVRAGRAPGTAAASRPVHLEGSSARIHLQDGTVLQGVPSDRLDLPRRLASRVSDLALRPGGLPAWAEADERLFVFPLDEVRVREGRALTRHGTSYRELELRHSLVVVRLETAAGPREVLTGLRGSQDPGTGRGS